MIDASVIRLENVSKIYNSSTHKVRGISDLSFCASRGELLLILGPSGSGKTTIITLAAGLIEATSGKVFIFGKDINLYSRQELQELRAGRIGFVFQNFHLIESLTIMENISLVQQFLHTNHRYSPKELLNKFSIEYLGSSFPKELSQGEKQRAAIARAIANNADLILADEPTASLESEQGYEIIKMLHTYAKEENKCVIAVSHDLRISEYSDRILKVEDGKIKYEQHSLFSGS